MSARVATACVCPCPQGCAVFIRGPKLPGAAKPARCGGAWLAGSLESLGLAQLPEAGRVWLQRFGGTKAATGFLPFVPVDGAPVCVGLSRLSGQRFYCLNPCIARHRDRISTAGRARLLERVGPTRRLVSVYLSH